MEPDLTTEIEWPGEPPDNGGYTSARVSPRSKCTSKSSGSSEEGTEEEAGKKGGAYSGRSTALAALFIDPPYTLDRLLKSESAVSLAAEFLGLHESDIGWNKKGAAFAFGPKSKSHLNGVYMLGEMLYAKRTGEFRHLTPSEKAVWGTRLFVELGLLDPAPLSDSDQGYWFRWRVGEGKWSVTDKTWTRFRVLAGFRCLTGIHWLFVYGRPVAFTRHHAARWCSIGVRTAYEAIAWLQRRWLIEHIRASKRAKLFLPGQRKAPDGGLSSQDSVSPNRTAHPQQGASGDSGNGNLSTEVQDALAKAKAAHDGR
jgi:hypothetical protein